MKKLTLLMMMTFLLLSISPTLLRAGNLTRTDPTSPAVNVTSTDEMARLARPEELKSIDQISITSSESTGLMTEAKPITVGQNERSRRHHNGGVYIDNGRHHHGGLFIGGGGALLVIVLIIVLI